MRGKVHILRYLRTNAPDLNVGLCSIRGLGTTAAVAGIPARVIIVARNDFGQTVTAHGQHFELRLTRVGDLDGPRAQLSPPTNGHDQVSLMGSVTETAGVYEGSYTASVTGMYELSVTSHGTHVTGSPSMVRVEAAPVSASMCRLGNPGVLASVRGGELSKLVVVAYDAFDNRVTQGGLVFEVDISGPPPLTGKVIDYEDGSYVVKFMVGGGGDYSLGVTLDGEHIPGSPFLFYAHAGNDGGAAAPGATHAEPAVASSPDAQAILEMSFEELLRDEQAPGESATKSADAELLQALEAAIVEAGTSVSLDQLLEPTGPASSFVSLLQAATESNVDADAQAQAVIDEAMSSKGIVARKDSTASLKRLSTLLQQLREHPPTQGDADEVGACIRQLQDKILQAVDSTGDDVEVLVEAVATPDAETSVDMTENNVKAADGQVQAEAVSVACDLIAVGDRGESGAEAEAASAAAPVAAPSDEAKGGVEVEASPAASSDAPVNDDVDAADPSVDKAKNVAEANTDAVVNDDVDEADPSVDKAKNVAEANTDAVVNDDVDAADPSVDKAKNVAEANTDAVVNDDAKNVAEANTDAVVNDDVDEADPSADKAKNVAEAETADDAEAQSEAVPMDSDLAAAAAKATSSGEAEAAPAAASFNLALGDEAKGEVEIEASPAASTDSPVNDDVDAADPSVDKAKNVAEANTDAVVNDDVDEADPSVDKAKNVAEANTDAVVNDDVDEADPSVDKAKNVAEANTDAVVNDDVDEADPSADKAKNVAEAETADDAEAQSEAVPMDSDLAAAAAKATSSAEAEAAPAAAPFNLALGDEAKGEVEIEASPAASTDAPVNDDVDAADPSVDKAKNVAEANTDAVVNDDVDEADPSADKAKNNVKAADGQVQAEAVSVACDLTAVGDRGESGAEAEAASTAAPVAAPSDEAKGGVEVEASPAASSDAPVNAYVDAADPSVDKAKNVAEAETADDAEAQSEAVPMASDLAAAADKATSSAEAKAVTAPAAVDTETKDVPKVEDAGGDVKNAASSSVANTSTHDNSLLTTPTSNELAAVADSPSAEAVSGPQSVSDEATSSSSEPVADPAALSFKAKLALFKQIESSVTTSAPHRPRIVPPSSHIARKHHPKKSPSKG
ncbi:CYTH3 protein [Thecamonas trahens ATCC 50062]|uniref:CYTH3 protein n=1 Tax=Thecamonas trahens ATCC 50062 TaxID=461836 RepID=A0A0L0D2A3_THETB|nr:CYTH3 protein [Thecamonas trahens ATCC 50062]KNC46417.1 CYTH3 protein [Thecamonas trahens ATCC 50062]|eukprot:XP_013760708.1 CYTH3 protein [Thecamonas trahens ATCC 50062]